jgi:hypothetical protein
MSDRTERHQVAPDDTGTSPGTTATSFGLAGEGRERMRKEGRE